MNRMVLGKIAMAVNLICILALGVLTVVRFAHIDCPFAADGSNLHAWLACRAEQRRWDNYWHLLLLPCLGFIGYRRLIRDRRHD